MSLLAKKLLMKPGQHWLVLHAPANYPQQLDPLPQNTTVANHPGGKHTDGILLFVKNSAELATGLLEIKQLLHPALTLWIVYPKKSSGIDTDLLMTSNWDQMGAHGLGGVAAAAIDDNWTALRFRAQELIKKDPACNEEIAGSPYAAYINIETRKITLPEAMGTALALYPQALDYFNSLSFTNRREYVLWILTAKQEKTKQDRLQKLVDKLLAGKKNPGEK